MVQPPRAIDVRRAADRMRTRDDRIDSRHSFSYGRHYDPSNTHFGLLLVHNDDVVAPGGGYEPHPHRDVEIVTWVLSGVLEHEDSTGHRALLRPGVAQVSSAGSGLVHAERPTGVDDVRVVQMWVTPDRDGDPAHARRDFGAALGGAALDRAAMDGAVRDGDGPVVVASGRPEHVGALPLRQRNAALHVARLRGGDAVTVPAAPWVHVFVTRGAVTVDPTGETAAAPGVGTELSAGDAVRFTRADGQRITAAAEGAEVLLWEMHATLGDR